MKHLLLQGHLLIGMSDLLGLGMSHGKPLGNPLPKVRWKASLSIHLVGLHISLLPMVLRLHPTTNKFEKAMPDNVILTVWLVFKKK